MDFFQSAAAPLQQISASEVILNLLLAFILGMSVAIVYRITNRNKAISMSFISTLIIMAMVVALVMMVIGNSIARAFSLVGALSIIRFRTVVKDNRDIAFVFFALTAGMAAGVGNYQIALYGVGVIIFLILMLDLIQFGTVGRGVYLLRLQIMPVDGDESRIDAIFNEYLSMRKSLAVKTVRMGQYIEKSYLVRIKRKYDESAIIKELTAVEGVDRVTLLSEDTESEV